MLLIFLSSGLFLGWSLGANDAANIFGTAIGTKMIRFRTAAMICSIFVMIGAVKGGAGATYTLGSLGSVNAIAGSFMVALSAGLTTFGMTKLKLPVSTSQAIVGAIIGWNFYAGLGTDLNSLTKIVTTWVASPILAAIFAIALFTFFKYIFNNYKIHLLRKDAYTRFGLILVGAFGSYSLGANNIANVMGVFVPVSPFNDINIGGLITISGAQQLFFIGGIAIAIGVFTYSLRVMQTVGDNLFRLSPVTALAVLLAQSLVLFIFASEGIESLLISIGLPPLPLVPVSSSQAVIGAIVGIALVQGARGIRYNVLSGIAAGWVTTPIIAGVMAFISLFFLQNVFNQEVSRKTVYVITQPVLYQLSKEGIIDPGLGQLLDKRYDNSTKFYTVLKKKTELGEKQRNQGRSYAQADSFYFDPALIASKINSEWFTSSQIEAIRELQGLSFIYRWKVAETLESSSPDWHYKPGIGLNKKYNRDLKAKYQYVFDTFRAFESED